MIRCCARSEEGKMLLGPLGLSECAINYFLSASEGCGSDLQWTKECGYYSKFPLSSIRAVSSATHNKPHVYVSEFHKYGRIKGLDIYTGDVLYSSYSKHLSTHHLYFAFLAQKQFALIVGEFHGSPIAIYIPEDDILISLSSRYPAGSPEFIWLCNCIDSHDFKGVGIVSRDNHLTDQPISLLLGFMSNLGHYFWQDIAGLSALIESNGRGLPSEIYFPSWLNWPLPGEIFPVLSIIPVIRCKSFQEASILANASDRVAMRFPGIAVTTALRSYIYNSMTLSIGYNTFNRIFADCLEYDCLWINLRSHNKFWRSQVTGLVSIVNRLSSQFSRLALYLDGMPDAQGAAEELKMQIPSNVPVRDGIGVDIRESIVWANNIKAYIRVVGSGLVINSWLAAKPGFAHANKAHLAQASFWQQASEDSIMPVFLSSDDLIEDAGEMYGGYDFDWEIAYQVLAKIFTNC